MKCWGKTGRSLNVFHLGKDFHYGSPIEMRMFSRSFPKALFYVEHPGELEFHKWHSGKY